MKSEQTRTSDIFIQSIFNTVHNFEGKVKKVSELTNIDPTILSNKCNPTNNHKLSIIELHNILSVTKDYQSLIGLSSEFNHACMQNNLHVNVTDLDLMTARTNWEKERANTCEIIDVALSNKKISKKEIIAIRKAMFDDFHKELSLLVRLRGYINKPKNREFNPSKVPTSNDVLAIINKSIDNFSGGIEELSNLMKTKAGILNNKCNPDNDKHLNVYELRDIIHITGESEILHTFCESLNHSCVEIKQYDNAADEEVLNIRSKWDAERGETDQVIEKALGNQIITEQEYKKIKKEMCEDFQWEMELLSRLESIQN